METIHIQSEKDRVVITIDKQAINQDFLLDLLERLEIQRLIQQADFDESIETLGQDIKANWWRENKHRFESLEQDVTPPRPRL
jgi:hypothetical protein